MLLEYFPNPATSGEQPERYFPGQTFYLRFQNTLSLRPPITIIWAENTKISGTYRDLQVSINEHQTVGFWIELSFMHVQLRLKFIDISPLNLNIFL